VSDERLNELFASLNEDLPATEFKDRVLRRIERAKRIRYLVLGGAAVLGLAFAAGPLLDLYALVVRELAALLMAFREADWSPDPTLVAALLLLALVPGLVRWLER
jgi:hypothetical protein